MAYDVEQEKKEIGARIKKLRASFTPPMTQPQLAGLLGVSESTIFKWEKGSVFIHSSDIDRLAAVLNTTARFLTTGVGPGILPDFSSYDLTEEDYVILLRVAQHLDKLHKESQPVTQPVKPNRNKTKGKKNEPNP
jgi:transcriptional regulator with XRE-family HTH domain